MKRGDIYWVNLEPTKGAEIRKRRPCVIISANPINEVRRTVIVVPLSTSAKAYPPITVEVACNNKQVTAVCDQIRAVDKKRLINCFDELTQDDLKKVEINLRQVMEL